MWKIGTILLTICAAAPIGCNPVTAHKITSTIFDGVPSLPPPEQFCQEYHEQKLAEERAAALTRADAAVTSKASRHAPYAEKKCDKCHDKTTESGLIRPPDKLCFLCHPGVLQGANMHGPAAVGSCLECHEAHSAPRPALLTRDKAELCTKCHKEKRLAEAMHQLFAAKGMLCVDCHDPHASNEPYFLK